MLIHTEDRATRREAASEVRDVLDSIGDTCPECPLGIDEAWRNAGPPAECPVMTRA